MGAAEGGKRMVESPRENVGRQMIKRAASLIPPRPGTVILLYHRVGGESSLAIDLARAEFDHQMARLAEARCIATLAAAVDHLQVPSSAPRREVVVTFDDGTADFAEVVLSLLVEHGIPVTLYLATAFVEEQRPFPDGGRPLSWAALRDACATGFVDVGSHTHTHALLDRLTPDRVSDELDRSKMLIEDRLSRPCLDFAYPKALPPSPTADKAVRARFRSAALAGTRANRRGHSDLYRLARSPVQRSDTTRYFEKKLEGGMRLEDDVRRILNRWRYRRAET